ncbi:DUF2922 domain-containing protein [Enterococcus sp. 669A]|uniref:DUF2922 domain-containing protein n=1 Tax=Candidatus Enterococcus moelleringii TaxID=2815325 RepID=A0ABS3LCX7_9ENTE|nr:DUF2922 domain-containing protein [Enterococcus sp. 669A]MBO1306888.1 DUF2922 domain-containing protein [Enterococcus sp. 669A]
MIKLASTFLNSEGKKHTLNIKNPDVEKSPEEIREALTLLTELDIFEKDGVGLFEEVVSAKFVETVETPIFKLGEFFGDADQPIVLNQPQLSYYSTVPELDVPVVELNTEELEEKENQQLAELLARSTTYQEMPSVPEVSLSIPEKETIEAVPDDPLDEPPLDQLDEPQTSSPHPLKELFRRRNRRKEKRRQRENPPNPPAV